MFLQYPDASILMCGSVSDGAADLHTLAVEAGGLAPVREIVAEGADAELFIEIDPEKEQEHKTDNDSAHTIFHSILQKRFGTVSDYSFLS